MSAKKLTPKELLAERNPLNRAVVAPVDIYDQLEAAEKATNKEVKAEKSAGRPPKNSKKPANKSADDPVGPYSTYLRKSQVKKIKHRAVDTEVKDQHIVQEAIDEYFRRRPEG